MTSERRHCEARKGVGARGRAKRPGRMRSVGVSEIECQVTLPWRNNSDLTIMVEFICAYNLELPASLPALRQHSKPIRVAAALPSPSNFGRRNNLHWEGSQGKQAHYCACDIGLYSYTTHVLNKQQHRRRHHTSRQLDAARPLLSCHVVQSCASDWLRSSHIRLQRPSVATTSGSPTIYYPKPSIAMFACRMPPGDMEAMCRAHWKRVGGLQRGGWVVQSQPRAWDHREETLEHSLGLAME